jgi:hypothetical protein
MFVTKEGQQGHCSAVVRHENPDERSSMMLPIASTLLVFIASLLMYPDR